MRPAHGRWQITVSCGTLKVLTEAISWRKLRAHIRTSMHAITSCCDMKQFQALHSKMLCIENITAIWIAHWRCNGRVIDLSWLWTCFWYGDDWACPVTPRSFFNEAAFLIQSYWRYYLFRQMVQEFMVLEIHRWAPTRHKGHWFSIYALSTTSGFGVPSFTDYPYPVSPLRMKRMS